MRHWQSIQFLMVIAGVCWCVAIFRRRHEDLAVFRQSGNPVDRWVVIGIWAATAVILLLLVTFGVGVVAEFWAMLCG